MDSRKQFEQLCAKSLADRLSPQESRELEALLEDNPKRREELEQLREVDPLLNEFGPLIEALEEPPPASFPEHRMGQLKTAVWEEFRDRVPQRKAPNVFSWLWDHAFPVTAAAAAGMMVVMLVLSPPQGPNSGTPELATATATVNAAEENSATVDDTVVRVVEFGVYNPVVYGDYTVQDLLSRLDARTEDALGAVDELNAVAEPFVRHLSFEMNDAFEQWKANVMDKSTYARVWVDKDLDTLHVLKRQDGRILEVSHDLPDDREAREALIRETLDELKNGDQQIKA
jgi:anti-sigma factor RsiW